MTKPLQFKSLQQYGGNNLLDEKDELRNEIKRLREELETERELTHEAHAELVKTQKKVIELTSERDWQADSINTLNRQIVKLERENNRLNNQVQEAVVLIQTTTNSLVDALDALQAARDDNHRQRKMKEWGL